MSAATYHAGCPTHLTPPTYVVRCDECDWEATAHPAPLAIPGAGRTDAVSADTVTVSLFDHHGRPTVGIYVDGHLRCALQAGTRSELAELVGTAVLDALDPLLWVQTSEGEWACCSCVKQVCDKLED